METAKILLVDNNKDSLRSWSGELRAAGFEVREALVTSVSAAREALEEGGFDLAILDVRLEQDDDPNDDSGLRLAEEYRNSGGSVPIILLSGGLSTAAFYCGLCKKIETNPISGR